MSKKALERVGTTIGDWKIIEQLPNIKQPCGTSLIVYRVECTSCGKRKDSRWKTLSSVQGRKSKPRCSCTLGPEQSERARHHFYKGTKDITGSYISGLKYSAKRRNLSYTVTNDYIQKLLEEQDYKCVYTGASITSDSGTLRSLDRIDSSKGYDEGNVQWVTWEVNRMKGALNESEFLQLVNTITQYRL